MEKLKQVVEMLLLLPGASNVSTDETLQTTGELPLPEEHKLENACFVTTVAKTFKQTKKATSNDRLEHKNVHSSKC